MFDSVVVPILLYECEIWGHENNELIEKLHLKFCRIILQVNNSTPKCMVLGELGRCPLQMLVDQRMLNYWSRTLSHKDSKLNKILYQILVKLSDNGIFESPWIIKVKHLLYKFGLENYWLNQHTPGNMKDIVRRAAFSHYENQWREETYSNQKCLNYRMFKTELVLEKYLFLLPVALRFSFTRFRLVNHKLPIERGRFENIPRHERRCTVCNELGDEFHFLFRCHTFRDNRQLLLGKSYCSNVSADNFQTLFSSHNPKKFCKVAKFVQLIMKQFS